MIEINLLPAGTKRRSAAPRRSAALAGPRMPRYSGDPYAAGLALLGVLVLLSVALQYWRTDARQATLAAELETEVADSTRFAATIQLLDAVRARQDTIRQKIDVIRSVDTRRYEWPHLLYEVSRALPPFTWLTSVTAADAEPAAPAPAAADSAAPPPPTVPLGPSFTVEGNSGNTQALTRFMKGLEESPFIREVTLVTSEQVEEEGRTFQKFTLEARYENPDSAFIQTTPVVLIR